MPLTRALYSIPFIVILVLTNTTLARYGAPPIYGKFSVQLNYIKNCDVAVGTHVSIDYERSKNESLIKCNAVFNFNLNCIEGTHSLYLLEDRDWKRLWKENYNCKNGLEKKEFLPDSFITFLNTSFNCPSDKVNRTISYEKPLEIHPNNTQELMYGRYKSVLSASRGAELQACIVSLFDFAAWIAIFEYDFIIYK